MQPKHSKTLAAIFARPTQGSIRFCDVEALVKALGGDVREGRDSRVVLQIGDTVKHAHRPHPAKEAKKYQVEENRAWLQEQGIKP